MTVRMLLPFSMGREVLTTHPFDTPYIEHPILDVGSSYSSVKQPIMAWCAEHYGNRISMGFDGNDYYIDFPTEADVTVFKLKWL